MGGVQVYHLGQPHAYVKENDGEPGQTAGQTSRHYDGHKLDALQGSWRRDFENLLMMQTA